MRHPHWLVELGSAGVGSRRARLTLLRGIFEGGHGAAVAIDVINWALSHTPEGKALASRWQICFRTVIPPGYDGTDSLPANEPYMSRVLEAMATPWSGDADVVVAESWGGAVAALSALQEGWVAPDVFISCGTAWSDWITWSARVGGEALALPLAGLAGRFAYPFILARALRASPLPSVRAFAGMLPDRGSSRQVAYLSYKAAARGLRLEDADISRLGSRVVLVHGTKDSAVYPRCVDELRRLITVRAWENVRAVEAQGCSHWATLEDPELLVGVLHDELERLAAHGDG